MALPAILMLEGEEPFYGTAVGASGVARGVVVASAYASGMGDLLTDPAYGGKIVCFTYPHVGTSGVVPEELQSEGVLVRGVAGREIGRMVANRLGKWSMAEYLERNGVPAIEDLDTRAVAEVATRRGMVRAVLGLGDFADADALAKEFASAEDPVWEAPEAGVSEPKDWNPDNAGPYRVTVYDFGVKTGFLRRLAEQGCRVRLVPKTYPAERALADKPSGIVFSAGTGTPESRAASVAVARDLLGKVPLWGVGVGAGVVAAAAGARVTVDGRAQYGVHPVGRVDSPLAEMTSQCHEFWIDEGSLAGASLGLTHFNLNDRTVEGFGCVGRRIMGTLYHPEGEPGPRDSVYLFEQFADNMKSGI